MRKAKGPKNKNKNFVTHLMTMPQAAGKNYTLALQLQMYLPVPDLLDMANSII